VARASIEYERYGGLSRLLTVIFGGTQGRSRSSSNAVFGDGVDCNPNPLLRSLVRWRPAISAILMLLSWPLVMRKIGKK